MLRVATFGFGAVLSCVGINSHQSTARVAVMKLKMFRVFGIPSRLTPVVRAGTSSRRSTLQSSNPPRLSVVVVSHSSISIDIAFNSSKGYMQQHHDRTACGLSDLGSYDSSRKSRVANMFRSSSTTRVCRAQQLSCSAVEHESKTISHCRRRLSCPPTLFSRCRYFQLLQRHQQQACRRCRAWHY